MTKNSFKILVLCVAGILINDVAGEIKINSLKIENNGEDYFGEIETEVKPHGNGSSVSVTVPIKQDLNEKLVVKLSLNFNKIPIAINETIMKLCDVMNPTNPLYQLLIPNIEPAGKFPPQCPIPKGTWKVIDTPIDFGDNYPSGDFDIVIQIGLPDRDPLIRILVDGQIVSSSGNIFLPSFIKFL